MQAVCLRVKEPTGCVARRAKTNILGNGPPYDRHSGAELSEQGMTGRIALGLIAVRQCALTLSVAVLEDL